MLMYINGFLWILLRMSKGSRHASGCVITQGKSTSLRQPTVGIRTIKNEDQPRRDEGRHTDWCRHCGCHQSTVLPTHSIDRLSFYVWWF